MLLQTAHLALETVAVLLINLGHLYGAHWVGRPQVALMDKHVHFLLRGVHGLKVELLQNPGEEQEELCPGQELAWTGPLAETEGDECVILLYPAILQEPEIVSNQIFTKSKNEFAKNIFAQH